MNYTNDDILNYLRTELDHPVKVKELAQYMDVKRTEYPKFRTMVKDLIRSGELVKLKRGRIGLASEMNMQVGRLAITKSGIGFLIREDDDDILIPAHALGTALDSDTVMVRLTGYSGDRQTGSVLRVVERAARNIVGVFHKGRHFAFVVPDNKRIHRDIYIPQAKSKKAKDGEKVVAHLLEWDDPSQNPEGEVIERIGFPGDPGVDMLTVIKSYGLPEEFPVEVMDQAERAAAKLSDEEFARREDLSQTCIYTIDPADAKDHDDGVSVEKLNNGYRLGVHIADVSYFVEENSVLDTEAFDRGNSCYLPGTVIPMIPEVLSNDVCSLRPNRKRLAFSVFMDFDASGEMKEWRLTDSVIKSKAKLSYEDVQSFFDGQKVEKRVERVADSLGIARELARLLSNRRSAEGSLDFDLPESKIILSDKGEVLELGNKVRLESHRLVEEFMLAANKAVALEMVRKAQPFIFRVHDRPDLEKMEAFSYLMDRLGYNFPVSPNVRPSHFARFLDKVKDKPEGPFINELMLRSMKKAVYQRQNIGHFGLAFKHYTHFTSPIRRYPDLLVHRLLRLARDGQYPAAFAKRAPRIIDHVGTHCSETERVAESAEREAVKMKQVQFMKRHVGDEFDGVISGVISHGFFVRLDELGAEGLVRVSTIDDDYYHHDEEHYRMVGRRTGRTFRLGDRVKVQVVKVEELLKEIDLMLLEGDSHGPGKKPTGPRGKHVNTQKTSARKSSSKPRSPGKQPSRKKSRGKKKSR